MALADLQHRAVEALARRGRGRRPPAARRRASRRPGPASAGPPSATCRSASAIAAGRWTAPLAAATASSSIVLGRRVLRRGRARSCSAAACAASAPWKRATSARASACLASRGDVPAGGRSTASSANHVSIASSGSDSVRPYISSGASVMPMWLPSDFDIFSTPSMPGQDRHGQHGLLGLAVGALDVARRAAG